MRRRDPNGPALPALGRAAALGLTVALALLVAAGCGSSTAAARPAGPVAPETAATEGATARAATIEAPAPPAPAAAVADPEPDADPARFAGLWDGAIYYQPGSAELEATLELGVDAGGKLVGTIDMAAFDMLYHPLEDLRVEGSDVYFSYRRDSEVRGPDALFSFEGRLDEDGALVGEFLESRGRIPFRFERLGDPGTPRPELERRPLADLSPEGDELERAFNEDEDKARLVLLLSPT